MSEIAVAFDVPTLDQALDLDRRLGPGPEIAKVGLQLYTAAGPEAVRALRERGRRVFLDLKLHDIPNTVRGAATEVARLGAELLTVHALGGAPMVAAAVEGVRQGGGETRVVAVTILTSLDGFNLPPGLAQPFHAVLVGFRLTQMALEQGADGVVCAARELPALRGLLGRPFFAVTPGIRQADTPAHDQARVATVADAVRAGSGLLVLGRAITAAPDPRAALVAARAERDLAMAGAPA